MDKDSKIIEPPIIRKKVQKRFKNEVKIRRKEIENLISNIGFRNARKTCSSLADHYQISERMIYKDFNWVKSNFKPEDLEELKKELKIARDNALSESMSILALSTTNDEKLKSIPLVIAASKHMTEQLEIWGIKPKLENISLLEETPINKKTFEVYQDIAEKYFELFNQIIEDKDKIKKILEDKLPPELAKEVFKEIKEKTFSKNLISVLPVKDKDGFIEKILHVEEIDSKDEIIEDDN